jgi:hypothetical protein
MKNKFLPIVILLLQFPMLVLAWAIYPTNLAGPGLDIPVFGFILIYDIYVLKIIVKKWKIGSFPKIYLIVLLSSFLLLYYLAKYMFQITHIP